MNGNVSNKPANFVRYYCVDSKVHFLSNLDRFNKTLPKQFYNEQIDRPLRQEFIFSSNVPNIKVADVSNTTIETFPEFASILIEEDKKKRDY